MLYKSAPSVVLGFILIFQACNSVPEKDTFDLAGEWAFQSDSLDVGVNENWFNKELDDAVKLPGSMLTNGKGDDITVNTRGPAASGTASGTKARNLRSTGNRET